MEKVRNLVKAIQDNGGIRRAFYQLYRMNDLKDGTLVGIDDRGNKYYENNRYFFGRNRWVEYSPSAGVDYDPSMVPPEWHGWLHHATDLPPTLQPPVQYPWMMKRTPNASGTRDKYVPYSTTKPKITPWQPKQSEDKKTR